MTFQNEDGFLLLEKKSKMIKTANDYSMNGKKIIIRDLTVVFDDHFYYVFDFT